MNFFLARALVMFAAMLDAAEREIILGDCAELELTPKDALTSLLGLVFRRQFEPLLHWQPWLLLIWIVLPAAGLLSGISANLAGASTVPLWMYTDNWTPSYLQRGWLWSELMPGFASMALSWLELACWSWTAGLLLASTRKFRLPFVAIILTLVLVASLRGHINAGDAMPGFFYRSLFPIILQVFLFATPVLLGMRHYPRLAGGGTSRRIVWAPQFVTVAALVSNDWVGRHLPSMHHPHAGRWAPLALAGPLAFALTSIFRMRRPGAPSLRSKGGRPRDCIPAQSK